MCVVDLKIRTIHLGLQFCAARVNYPRSAIYHVQHFYSFAILSRVALLQQKIKAASWVAAGRHYVGDLSLLMADALVLFMETGLMTVLGIKRSNIGHLIRR